MILSGAAGGHAVVVTGPDARRLHASDIAVDDS
jgi:hypothetical protein